MGVQASTHLLLLVEPRSALAWGSHMLMHTRLGAQAAGAQMGGLKSKGERAQRARSFQEGRSRGGHAHTHGTPNPVLFFTHLEPT